MPETPDYSKYLTTQELADLLGIKLNTAQTVIQRQTIPSVLYRGRRLIAPEVAARYKRQHDLTRRTPPPGRE